MLNACCTCSVTSATSGYVSDDQCAICHSEIYKSYQEVGMAVSR